jgi:tetratricopeptide (TPR) repeat protein
MRHASDKLYVFLICLVLILATLIAYEPLRHNGFVEYDDNDYVVKNPHVYTGLTPGNVKWAFTSFHASNWHPLTWLSHMLDCELFGLNPYWHHLTNLLLHIMNTLLLFWILKKITSLVWPSAIVAALFALHPMHVESVAWVSERKDMLSGLFWMITMAAYVWYAERPCMGRYLLVFLSLGLGLMAKPMLVTLPFVLLLLDYWPLDRLSAKQPDAANVRYQKSTPLRLVAEKIPLFILAIGSSVITCIVQIGYGTEVLADLPLKLRTANAFVSYVSYITKMIYPARLAALYPYPYPYDSFPVWQSIVSCVLLIVIFLSVVYLARRYRHLAVGWLWYFGTLVPVIGLVQVGAQAMADRYSYIPSIGLFIMVSFSGYLVSYKHRYQKILLGVFAGLVLVVLLFCTRTQVRYWQNGLTLFGRAIAVTKNNYLMQDNYGCALLKNNQPQEAVRHFHEAIRLYPLHAEAHNNLGVAYCQLGRYEEAKEACKEAIKTEPDYTDAYYNLGVAYGKLGRWDEAIEACKQAIRIKPDWQDVYEVYNQLGAAYYKQEKFDEAIKNWGHALQLRPDMPEVHNHLALAFYKQGQLEEAIKHWREALRLKPDWQEVRDNLDKIEGRWTGEQSVAQYMEMLRNDPNDASTRDRLAAELYQQGKIDQAIEQWKEVIRLRPEWAEAQNSLATAYYRQGDVAQAIKHWAEAVRLKPDWAEAMNNLAWVLAAARDENLRNAGEAVRLAERACEITKHESAGMLDTLAVAYAAGGRFIDAISAAEKAVELARTAGEQQLAEDIQKRLELYKINKAYCD